MDKMDDLWIKKSIKELRNLYKYCEKKEKALTFYVAGFIKILNSIGELQTTYFHHYEWRVLWYPMKLFAEYFIEQIKDIIENEYSFEAKNQKIGDVENALASISEVYRNLIDGTVNSDRRMMTTLGIDTNIYELSPKLCSFYSLMLSKMVIIFDDPNKRKYSFILYPTFRRYTEMKLLFEERQANGKIAVINISNSIIEKYKIIPVILGHEMFHVLLREQHLAKVRALSLYSIMNIYAQRIIFDGVVFDGNNQERDSSIKTRLFKKWFANAVDMADEIKNLDDDSRELYSKPIKDRCIRYISENIKAIVGTLEDDLKYELYSGEVNKFCEYEEINKNLKRYIGLITANIFKENVIQKVSKYCDKIMSVFREVYADIACILTLNIPPKLYKEAFFESEFFGFENEDYEDLFKFTRMAYVSCILKIFGNIDFQESWNEIYCEAQRHIYGDERASPNKKSRVNVENACITPIKYAIISTSCDKIFISYFKECTKKIQQFIVAKQEDVVFIQKEISRIINADQETFLKDVLSGVAETKYFNQITEKDGGKKIENSN